MKKVVSFENLPLLIKHLKAKKEILVLAGGCFDILHLGHIRFLDKAKKHGTLIVALESDQNLRRLKGLSRPFHQQKQRAEMLASLESVDYIIPLPSLATDEQYSHFTQTISPDIIAVTEGDPQLKNKQKQVKLVGGKIIVIPKIKTPSTSQLLKLLTLEQV